MEAEELKDAIAGIEEKAARAREDVRSWTSSDSAQPHDPQFILMLGLHVAALPPGLLAALVDVLQAASGVETAHDRILSEKQHSPRFRDAVEQQWLEQQNLTTALAQLRAIMGAKS